MVIIIFEIHVLVIYVWFKVKALIHCPVHWRIQGGDARHMGGSNSFIFMQFLAQNLQNNRLAHPLPLWELAPPQELHCSGGSMIPQTGAPIPLNLGQKSIICQDCCQKLHKNEINWTERGGASPAPPLDPPMLPL